MHGNGLIRAMLLAFVVAACTPSAGPVGQSEGAPPHPDDDALFDQLPIRAEELPAQLTLIEGVYCHSVQARMLFDQPELYDKILGGKMTFKRVQSLAVDGQPAGSILYFRHERPIRRGFFEGLLWGQEGHPTAQHPEELITFGRHMMVLCFGSPGGIPTWFAKRLSDLASAGKTVARDAVPKGVEAFDAGRFADAATLYGKAIADAPNVAALYFLRASAYMKQGQTAQALLDFDRAVALNPMHGAFQNNYADALVIAGRHKEALPHVQAAMRIEPQEPVFVATRGQVHEGLGDMQLACTDYKASCEGGFTPVCDDIKQRNICHL